MTTPAPRTAHPFAMYDEMHGQPQAMATALTADMPQRDHIARELAGTHAATETIVGPGFLMPHIVGPGRIWLAGCGTAYHAALIVADWLRQGSEHILDAQAMQAFEFAHYSSRKLRTHDALLALSHSGTATATIASAERAREAGLYSVAVTAIPDSPLTRICDETLLTHTGPTIAGTYTISHTAMLAALADLTRRATNHLRSEHARADELAVETARFPELAQAVLDIEPAIKDVVAALPDLNQLIVGGGGPNWPTAFECALKVREASYLPATGFEIEEIVHGRIASIDAATGVLLIAPAGPSHARAMDILRAVRHVGATTIVLASAGDAESAALADQVIALPDCDESSSVIPATIAVQEIAYWLAIRRGGNPDRIRRDQPQWEAARQSYTR